ncbi:MAG: hypothetical protein JSV89_06855, partial [Spirochaetaceae bacterium]
TYAGMSVNAYFWRTYTGAELDYVEDRGGQLNGFEMNFQPRKGRDSEILARNLSPGYCTGR